MKKYFVIAILAVIATSSYYCTKKTSDATIERQSDEPQLDKIDIGPACNCAANQTSCSSSCLFSDCCICYDPKRESGACGCYFGIAKCDSGPIGVSSNATGARTIHFYKEKFDRFVSYLNRFGSSTSELSASSNRIGNVGQMRQSEKGSYINVSAAEYQTFFKTYETYINSLTPAELQELSQHLTTLK